MEREKKFSAPKDREMRRLTDGRRQQFVPEIVPGMRQMA
jgi:hypothetical protein